MIFVALVVLVRIAIVSRIVVSVNLVISAQTFKVVVTDNVAAAAWLHARLTPDRD
jgi:hypothetical protein